MLVSAKEMLDKAKAGHYAVGQFNINNLEWTKAILLTAQELNSPVILPFSTIQTPIALILSLFPLGVSTSKTIYFSLLINYPLKNLKCFHFYLLYLCRINIFSITSIKCGQHHCKPLSQRPLDYER